jgi:hypothetical protein
LAGGVFGGVNGFSGVDGGLNGSFAGGAFGTTTGVSGFGVGGAGSSGGLRNGLPDTGSTNCQGWISSSVSE